LIRIDRLWLCTQPQDMHASLTGWRNNLRLKFGAVTATLLQVAVHSCAARLVDIMVVASASKLKVDRLDAYTSAPRGWL